MKWIPRWQIILWATILYTGSVYAQLPVLNGWTQFTPSNDSRIVYVSDVSGDDGTAQVYTSASPEVGADPFLPGAVMPYKTLAAAVSQLRNGYPDWVLLKKGEIWTGQSFGSLTLYGRNDTEPMLIGSYGTALQRPEILTGTQGFVNLTGASASFLVINGLYITPHLHSGTEEPVGIRIIDAPFRSILVEDCYITGYFQNIAILDPLLPSGPTRSNLKFRRSVIADAYTVNSAHANAMFIADVDSILMEGCLLDHNGWSSTIAGADPTGFRHNSYFQVGCTNLDFRENIVARAAANGGGHRSGGNIFNNLYLYNPKNIRFGTSESTINWPVEAVSGEVSYNVILGSRPESFDAGFGISVERARNAYIHHNIIAHFTAVSNYNIGLFVNEAENVRISKNIIYKWGNNAGPVDFADAIRGGVSLLPGNQVDSNEIQMENAQGYCVNNYNNFQNITFTGNMYHNVNAPSDWFSPGGNYSGWLSASGETGSSVVDINYADPERNISTYLTAVGESGTLDDFLQFRRLLSRDNWDMRFTAEEVNRYIREGFNMAFPLSAEPQVATMSLEVYPNPASAGFYWNSNTEIQHLRVINSAGSIVKDVSFPLPGNMISLDGLPGGLYVVIATSQPGNACITRIIKR